MARVTTNNLLCSILVVLIAATSLQVGSAHAGDYSSGGYWTQLDFVDGPSPRVFAASTVGSPVPPPYAPTDRSGLVVFGGTNDPESYEPTFNDLWVLNPQDDHNDGRTWTEISILPGTPLPAPRCLSAVAVAGTQLYLFGGFNGTTWFSDLWVIDMTVIQNPGSSAKWVFLGDTNSGSGGPPEMCGMTMVWSNIDSESSQLVLFGGGVDKKELYGNVWTYDTIAGEGWTEYSPTGIWPPAREFHSASISKDGTQMTVFGGYDYGYTYYQDMWTFDVAQVSWKQVVNLPKPPARANFAAALVPASGQFALAVFGGRSNLGQTVYSDSWYHTDMGWNQATGTNPGPRYGSASGAYDAQESMILFGGVDQDNVVHNDTWFFTLQYGL